MTRWLVAVTALLVAILLAFPEADLAVSQWFYRPGERFPYADSPLARGVYDAIAWVTCSVVAALVGLALARLHAERRGAAPGVPLPSWRMLGFVALLLALGPGFAVNTGCKNLVPRPRPREVQAFGGPLPYVGPLRPGGAGGESSASGHAAMGFFFAGVALALDRRKARTAGLLAGLAAGLLVGASRVAQGAHFASDIVVTGLVVLWVSHGLCTLMAPRPPAKDPTRSPRMPITP